MQALYYPAFDQLEIRDVEDVAPKPDEVKLKVAACGICGSELESVKNHSPRRPPPFGRTLRLRRLCLALATLGA